MFINLIKWLRIIFGNIFLLLGILGVGFGFFDIIDPIGSKMADDGDPFGTPNTLVESYSIIIFYALVLIVGLWLIIDFGKRKLR